MFVFRIVFLLVIFASPVLAEQAPPWQSSGDTQQMVRDLRALIDKGANSAAADREYLGDLRNLAARYHWPWTRRLLKDEFADGDYTKRPAWRVESGTFRVDKNLALRSELTRAAPVAQQEPKQEKQKPGDFGRQILGDVLREITKPQQNGMSEQDAAAVAPAAGPADRAEIAIARTITRDFDIRLVLTSEASEGRFEYGPYAADGTSGYRLAYAPGGRPSLMLLRYSQGASAVIEARDAPLALEDGKPHYLEWMRDARGRMVVYLDGKEVLRTRDRAFREAFSGFRMSNLGGAFGVREVEILGTP